KGPAKDAAVKRLGRFHILERQFDVIDRMMLRRVGHRRLPQTSSSNRLGSFSRQPSIFSILSLVLRPPLALKPTSLALAPMTRWHGTTIAKGLRPSAWPTARAPSGSPMARAISP